MMALLLVTMLALVGYGRTGECVVVESAVKPASPNIQIVVWRAGKPAEKVVVRLTPADKPTLTTASTDARGLVAFSDIPPGDYAFFAATTTGEEATLYVHVEKVPAKSQPSVFALSLEKKSEAALAVSSVQLDKVESEPAEIATKSFEADALDESGAVIPGADVWIIATGNRDPSRMIRLKADSGGHFSAAVPDGRYTIAVQMPGFRPKLTTVDVGKNNEVRKITITLRLASC